MHKSLIRINRRQVLTGMAVVTIAAAVRPVLGAQTPVGGTQSTSNPRLLTKNDLQNLLYGLGFSASGGGGGYLIGQALLNAIINDIDPSKWLLWDPTAAADTDYAVMAGGIGAPSAITPDTILKFVTYAQSAILYYNDQAKQTINALVPVEAGPVNGLLALYLGWKYGYKVFDCDGAGRAVPSLTNLVYDFNQSQYKIAPVVLSGLVDYEPVSIVVTPAPTDGASAENAIRDNLGEFGDAAALVCWGQTGAQLKASPYLLAHTFTNLIDFGAQAAATGFTEPALTSFLKSSSNVIAVYTGTVAEIDTGTQPGYDDAVITVGAPYDVVYQIHALNENMILTQGVSGTTVLATAPSGIAMLFQPNGTGPYVLLNNGDSLPDKNVINSPIIIAVMKESCTLFNAAIAQSFANVLSAAPFNYSGPLVPSGTCTP
jgi:DUF917 family protein